MGGAMAIGVGGAAAGLLGGMLIGDVLDGGDGNIFD